MTDDFGDVANSGDDRLRAWVREDFGVQLSSIDRVGHGADAAAEVWRGIAVDGPSTPSSGAAEAPTPAPS